MINLIINGYPRSGKDTMIGILQHKFPYNTYSYSTIDKIKEMAKIMGWQGDKTPENRQMLSDLKKFYNDYFKGTQRDIITLVSDLYAGNNTDFLCICSREPEEIQWIYNYSKSRNIDCYRILVKRLDDINYNITNYSDTNVLKATYDICIENFVDLDYLELEIKEKIISLVK